MKYSMLSRIFLTILIVCLALFFSTISVLGMGVRPPVIGSPAPDFQLTDLQGKTQRLSQYRGKVVLLNFWATWCKPCIKEMPAMQNAYDDLREQGFTVLAINELEDKERVRKHIARHEHTFQVLMDEDNEVANMYGVVGLPVTVFIDQTGHIQEFVKGGLLTEDLIHKTVNQLLANTSSLSTSTPES